MTDPALRQLLDSARSSDSSRSRAGFAALHRHRADDATLVGLLANLAECKAFVSVTTTTGAELLGTIAVSGLCGIVLEKSQSDASLIRTAAIASVRSVSHLRLDGDGIPQASTSWPTFLSSHIELGEEISLMVSAQHLTGNVVSLNRSLLVLGTPDGGAFYAVVDEIDEVSIRVPGSIRHD
ncbi:MAG: hypothetical protein NT081_01380 [Actinobacteria bacterium]|nr:hypothetical protein [Actinomycetota bacterium]